MSTVTPSMLWDDTPRTGKHMPESSHKAADRSQRTIKGTAVRVLELVHRAGPLTGAELNELYRETWPTGPNRAAYDSPRKRARELTDEGLLNDVSVEGDDAAYALSIAGLEAVLS